MAGQGKKTKIEGYIAGQDRCGGGIWQDGRRGEGICQADFQGWSGPGPWRERLYGVLPVLVGSSNTKDVTAYCEEKGITYLTTCDFLYYAIQRGLMTKVSVGVKNPYHAILNDV